MTITLSQVIALLAQTDEYNVKSHKVIWSDNAGARYHKYTGKSNCDCFGLECDRYRIMFALRKEEWKYSTPDFYYNIYLVNGDNYNSHSAIFFKMMADEWDILDDIGLTNSYNTKVLEHLGGWKEYKTFDERYNLLRCLDTSKAKRFLIEYYHKHNKEEHLKDKSE